MPVLSNDDFANFGAPAATAPKVLSTDDFDSFGAPEPSKPALAGPAAPGDIGGALPEAYLDPSNGLGASLVKAAKSVPHSAYEFGKNTLQPLLHPVDTATGIKNLGMGVLEKSGLVSGNEHEKYADEVGHFLAERYGGLDKARKTFEQDPVGMAGDLSMILTGGGSAAARLPGALGKIGEVTSAIGRTVDPLTPVLAAGSKAANLAGRGAAQVVGLTTGVGHQPFEVAARAGLEGGPRAEAFRDSITGRTQITEVVDDARHALDQLRQERGNEYRQAMSKTGQIGSDTKILDFNKIDNAVMKASGVQTYSGRYGTGPAQQLNPKTAAIRGEMMDVIEQWKSLDPAEFHSAEGIDALKKKLGDIRDDTAPGTPARVAANHIYNAVRQTIIDQVPTYAKVMKAYEKASDHIKEVMTELSAKPNAHVGTTVRKLQSAVRDNVNTGFGYRTNLVNSLADVGAPHLMEKLSGQALHNWTPRGLGRLVAGGIMEGIPALALGAGVASLPAAVASAAATLPTMSPRLMGNAAYGLGATARYAHPIASRLPRSARQIGELSRVANSPYGAVPGSPYAP